MHRILDLLSDLLCLLLITSLLWIPGVIVLVFGEEFPNHRLMDVLIELWL